MNVEEGGERIRPRKHKEVRSTNSNNSVNQLQNFGKKHKKLQTSSNDAVTLQPIPRKINVIKILWSMLSSAAPKKEEVPMKKMR